MSSPIHRIKLYEDVANHIIERIQSEEWTGRLPPEDQLAQEFDVSRSTIREAIRSLQIAGILRSRAGAGTYVSESAPMLLGTRALAEIMSEPEGLRDLVQTRYVLEPQLAALAAHAATQTELQKLSAIVDNMQEKKDRISLMTLGHSFHMELSEMAHNRLLSGFYQSAANQLKGMRVLESLTLEVYLEGIAEHRAIAEAVAARDAQLASQRMREHLRKDYADWLQCPDELF